MNSLLISKRRTVAEIKAQKGTTPLVALTAYTAPIAKLVDEVADIALIGDSLGMVIYGMPDTLSVTLDMMIPHARCVVANTQKALCIFDMPFGTYQASPQQAYENAARAIQETGAQAVKLEGGAEMAATIQFLVKRSIPVCAHIGLQPQQVRVMGGYKVQGKDDESARRLMNDAFAVEEAGAFAVVIEGTAENAAAQITRAIDIPTIGIGASATCDGQILVTEDALGLTPPPHAKFVKNYASLYDVSREALARYADEVKARKFPTAEHTYHAALFDTLKNKKA